MIGGKLVEYGYLWWLLSGVDPIHKGAFEAQGIFRAIDLHQSQGTLSSCRLECARPKPTGMNGIPDETFFSAVVKAPM